MSRTKAEQFIKKAVIDGKFGDNTEIVKFIFDDTIGQDQFASSVVFVKVELKQQDVIKNTEVVVKMQQDNESIRQSMNTDTQFHNEKLMYEEVLPFLNQKNIVKEIFPECFYGYATSGKKPLEDVIIVDDLRNYGFRLSTERLHLDYEHCILTLKQLGRFHALSYAAKKRDFKQFINQVKKLKETHYVSEKRQEVNEFLVPSIKRGILPLLEIDEYKNVLQKFANCLEDPFKCMQSMFIPEEPIAVVCHGDFCRNNILYKYEENKPIDVNFFDLATSRYSSPAIDLSFFFFMNIPSDIRRAHWNDLLFVYHDSLSNAIPGTDVPSLDDIKKEMRRKSMYAYVLCSFFIPMMMDDVKVDMEEFSKLSNEEQGEIARTLGGDEATKIIAAIVKDMILQKCL